MVTRRIVKKKKYLQDAQDSNLEFIREQSSARSSIEICDVSKLNLHRFQNKQIKSDSVLQFQM